jgi:hypothetical protein
MPDPDETPLYLETLRRLAGRRVEYLPHDDVRTALLAVLQAMGFADQQGVILADQPPAEQESLKWRNLMQPK